MDYISTKELAQKWQIDPSRIVRLAKAGRIPGAMLVGNTWMFPADSERLPDNRRKENKQTVSRQSFRFPLYYYTKYTEAALGQFTEDERILYDAECACLRGEYANCCSMLTRLADQTDDITVKLGALYTMCMSNYFLRQFTQAIHCFHKLQTILQDDIPNKKALALLQHDLESYFVGNRFYLDEFSLNIDPDYMPQMCDYYMLQIAFSDVMRAYLSSIPANPLPYELYCCNREHEISPYSAALLHLYTAMLFSANGETQKAAVHVQKSCSISETNGIEIAIAFAFHYIPEVFLIALKDTNPVQLSRLKELSDEATGLFNALHTTMKKNNILHQLNANDTKFVAFAKQGMTNKEVSSVLGLSSNTISKKYSMIFEKTGTHSKKELVQLYTEAMESY